MYYIHKLSRVFEVLQYLLTVVVGDLPDFRESGRPLDLLSGLSPDFTRLPYVRVLPVPHCGVQSILIPR